MRCDVASFGSIGCGHATPGIIEFALERIGLKNHYAAIPGILQCPPEHSAFGSIDDDFELCAVRRMFDLRVVEPFEHVVEHGFVSYGHAQARVILAQAAQVKEIISEDKQSLSGVFRLGVLPTIAPYLLPRFFPQLMEKYPELDIRVTEMKTQDIQQALHAGDLDAGIIASKLEDTFLTEETLFYEQFYAYVSRKEPSFKHDVIRTSDITGEHLWLLDEGHCFRDQLVRFCQMEAVKVSQMAYRLGSMETFMRMVESGKGITFIPELAVAQLTEEQRQLVRPFAIPRPTRQVVLATNRDFIRHSLLCVLKEEIKAAVPKEMLTLQSIQCLL